MNDHKHDEVLIDRLRDLAGGAEAAATLAAPERVRSRGTRRRNRVRIVGAGALTACVVAGAAWAAQPGETARHDRVGPAAGGPATTPANPVTPPAGGGWIGLMDHSYLPVVAGVDWSIRDNLGMPGTSPETMANLFGPCASISLRGGLAGSYGQVSTPAGSHVKTYVGDAYASNRSPQDARDEVLRTYTAWQATSSSCLTRVPSNVPGTDVWSWSSGGKKGTLLTTNRGSALGWIATEMVAGDPDYPLPAEVGPVLMDKAVHPDGEPLPGITGAPRTPKTGQVPDAGPTTGK
ncbi:hypothetical protein [Embleya sp. AB8]|uniref:hypothetical protein n=1 Tax=Embleya sp. AB8 TaxID=3156304 RepID=UPI003C74FBBB